MPSAWNDLADQEMFFIAETLLQLNDQNASQTRGAILYYLISERAKSAHKTLPGDWLMWIVPEQFVRDVYPLIDFIFKENDRTICPFIAGYKMEFEDITCGEFEDCEMAAFRFSEDNDLKHLAEIAAILFKPKGEPYIKYNSRTDSYLTYKADKKVKHFEKLKPEILYAMFIWYSGSRNQLRFIFPDLFTGGKSDPDPMIFTNTIHAGAGPKNGSRSQIRCMKLYEFLYDCNQEAKKAAELEAEYAKMNK